MPSKVPLTKSYYDRRDPKYPTLDVTLYSLWDNAKKNGFVGDILNLETGERMTNLEILDLVSHQLYSCTYTSLFICISDIYVCAWSAADWSGLRKVILPAIKHSIANLAFETSVRNTDSYQQGLILMISSKILLFVWKRIVYIIDRKSLILAKKLLLNCHITL